MQLNKKESRFERKKPNSNPLADKKPAPYSSIKPKDNSAKLSFGSRSEEPKAAFLCYFLLPQKKVGP
jgi:hypothetical protein